MVNDLIQKMLCKENSTLLNAMQIINKNAKGVVFIVDESDKLRGILTDGDIRRLILSGNDLQVHLSGILNNRFVFARTSESHDEMLAKVNDVVKILPVVDENQCVVDYFEWRKDIHIPVTTPNLRGNELKYLMDAFLSTWVSSKGKYIEKFEQDFAQFCTCEYGVAVSSGTAALHLALVALGIGKGDEVIVPDLTFAATINAVLHANATPVIVDIDQSWCIDPKEIEKAITPRTRGIIPVHLYGQPCDMEAIMGIARRHQLYVVEDCAEAHGARFDGRMVGSFGDIGCFSFFGNKVITTGEGGMCVTNSKELDEKMRTLRDHGMSRAKKYWHECIGYNYRMTNLQAAIGVAQIERIDETLRKREDIENRYRDALSSISYLEFQSELPKRDKITWLVSALLSDGRRDTYLDGFKKEGIDVRPFFNPLSSMPIYQSYCFSNKNSLEISQLGVNFPTLENLDESYFKRIAHILRS